MTLVGSQVPTFSYVPASASGESWKDVADLCSSIGHDLDPWQVAVLRAGLGETSDGLWAASRVCLSASRQNGKSEILVARELAGLVLFGEELLIHSAHLVSTSLEAFQRIKEIFEGYDDLRRRVRRIRESAEDRSVEMMTGGRLLFRSRARSAGRGLTPDVLMLDEAQILPERTWASLVFAMSSRVNGQAWLAGTPPGPEDDAEAFARLRTRAREGKDRRLAWLEWAAGRDDDVSNPEIWAKTNPAYGVRVLEETIRDELGSTERYTFARERLGVWPDAAHEPVIRPEFWAACATADPPTEGPVAYAVDMSPDRATAAIAAARRTPDLVHVEVTEHRPVTSGTAWIVSWLTARAERGVTVVIDAMSPAAALIPPLTEAGIKVTLTGTRQMIDACGGFYDAVSARTLSHFDQAPLNAALLGARRRYIGHEGGWGWNRRSADITPLVAATLARYGVMTSKKATRQVAGGGRRSGGRVVLLP